MKARVKRFGFIIGAGTLLYRLVSFFVLNEDIFSFWNRGIFIYFALYLVSFFTIKSSVTDDKKSKKLSLIMIIVSVLLLYIDYLSFLGIYSTQNGISVYKSGISPVADALNLIANIVILIQCRLEKYAFGVPDTFDTEKEALSHAFGFINIIAILVMAYILYSEFQKINMPIIRSSIIIERTIAMMEKKYDVNFKANAGSYREADLSRDKESDKELYTAKIFWDYKEVHVYLEVLPNNRIIYIKDDFQSVKYSTELENKLYVNYQHKFEINFRQYIAYNDGVSGYTDYMDFYSSIPEGECVDINCLVYEDRPELDKDKMEAIISELPANLEGNLIIKLDQSRNYDFDDDIIQIIIPYSHNQLHFSEYTFGGNFQSSRPLETILSYSDEYLLVQITTAVIEAEEAGMFPEEVFIDYSNLYVSQPVNEYERYESGSIKKTGECYIVYCGDDIIGTATLSLVGNTYKYVIDERLAEPLTVLNASEICLLIESGHQYIYDGKKFYRVNPGSDMLSVYEFGNGDKYFDELKLTDLNDKYPD